MFLMLSLQRDIPQEILHMAEGPLTLFFFNKFIYLFICIYFWLRWVFVAAHGLSLVVVSGGYSSMWCTGFSLQWLLLLQSTGSRCTGFSSCSAWAQLLHSMQDLPGPGLKPVSPALKGGFLITAPPGKSRTTHSLSASLLHTTLIVHISGCFHKIKVNASWDIGFLKLIKTLIVKFIKVKGL